MVPVLHNKKTEHIKYSVLEATIGIEPMMEILQTSALPLGYIAPSIIIIS